MRSMLLMSARVNRFSASLVATLGTSPPFASRDASEAWAAFGAGMPLGAEPASETGWTDVVSSAGRKIIARLTNKIPIVKA
jgi:hypothetical protein